MSSSEPQARNRRFFTAPSQDRAVLEAASYLEVEPEQVVFKKVEARGLARGKGVTIRVDHEATAARVAGAVEESVPVSELGRADSAEAEGSVTVSDMEARESLSSESAAPAEPSVEARDEFAGEESEGEEEESSEDAGEESGCDESPAEDSAEEVAAADSDGPSPGFAVAEIVPPASLGEKIELPRSPVDLFSDEGSTKDSDVTESGQRWVDALLDLAELDLTVRVEERGDQVWFDLDGPDSDLLLEDSGQILESVQHLLPRLMQSDLSRVVSCVADSNGFREFHLERLRTQAVASAEAVRSQGRAISLEPMNPPDRRAVHMTLADDPAVETESSGRGYFKRITVRPA